MSDEPVEVNKRKQYGFTGSARIAVLAGAIAFGIGIATALVLVRPLVPPEWGAAESDQVSVDVTLEPYQDERSVPVSAQQSETWEARTSSTGILRETSCKAGEPLASGSSPFLIDDRRLFLLHLESPPWRGFQYGISGSDVGALQAELKRLGFYSEEPDGYFGSDTGRAVAELRMNAGTDSSTSELPLSDMIWIPAEQVVPTSCSAKMGDTIGGGAALFTTGGGISSLVVDLPDSLAPGARSAVAGSVTSPLPEDGSITDPVFLSTFAQTPKYEAFLKDSSTALTISVRLDDAIQVAALPASALYRINGDRACVLSGSTPESVEIVASQFGNTLVVPERPVSTVRVSPPNGAPACG